MAGLVPAIHVFLAEVRQAVDARHKAGHDEREAAYHPRRVEIVSIARDAAFLTWPSESEPSPDSKGTLSAPEKASAISQAHFRCLASSSTENASNTVRQVSDVACLRNAQAASLRISISASRW